MSAPEDKVVNGLPIRLADFRRLRRSHGMMFLTSSRELFPADAMSAKELQLRRLHPIPIESEERAASTPISPVLPAITVIVSPSDVAITFPIDSPPEYISPPQRPNTPSPRR